MSSAKIKIQATEIPGVPGGEAGIAEEEAESVLGVEGTVQLEPGGQVWGLVSRGRVQMLWLSYEGL